MRYPVVLFDLFRTVVVFTPQAPTGKVHDPTWPSAMQALRGLAAELLPEMDFEKFLDVLTAASDEIAHERSPEYLEVPIAERYAQALARLGFHGPRAASAAERLSARQAEVQSANSLVPAEHAALLRELAASRRLGLVSNYDHGRMVHELLAHHGIDRFFSATLISIEFGRRKPHRAIFEEALRRLDAAPEDAALRRRQLGGRHRRRPRGRHRRGLVEPDGEAASRPRATADVRAGKAARSAPHPGTRGELRRVVAHRDSCGRKQR